MNLISKFVDTVLSEHTWPRAEGRRACLCMYVCEGGRSDKGLCGNKVRARGGNSPRRPHTHTHTDFLYFTATTLVNTTNFFCITFDISQHNIEIVTRLLRLSSMHDGITFTLTDFYTQTHGGTDIDNRTILPARLH